MALDLKNSGKYRDIEALGRLLKTAREERRLSRGDVGRWVSNEEKMRSLEEGKEGDFWEIRQVVGRLHIPSNMVSAYLNPQDNALVNLELEIWYDLLFWRYGQAERKLQRFYGYCDRKNVAMMQSYYRLLALFLVRQSRWEDQRTKELQDFIEKHMPDIEKSLWAREVFSPDELSLIAAYDRLVERKAEECLKKLYSVVYYFRETFAREEHQHPFYAELMFACAQELYRLGDYVNCVQQCMEGIKVTKYFRKSVVGGELYELMADASGEMLKKELTEKKLYVPDKGVTEQIDAVLDDYLCADAQYSAFYFGYQDGHKEELERKMKGWRTMTGHKS